MATPIETIMTLLLLQDGDRYIFGTETDPLDPDPEAFDCSEIIQWACARAGVQPTVPDGSWIQARHCRNHNTIISVDAALNTRGALLFKFSSDPFSGGRPDSAHVAVSLGNGMTFEARSTRYGVGTWAATGRGWTQAALLPGVNYVTVPPTPDGVVGVLRDPVAKAAANGRLPVWKATSNGMVLPANGARHLGDLAALGIKPDYPVTDILPMGDGYVLFCQGDDATFRFPV